MVSLLHLLVDEDNIWDPDYGFDCEVKKRARTLSFLLQEEVEN